MKAIRRNTRLIISNNPSGVLANILWRQYRAYKLKQKRRKGYESNSRTT